jgi:predicted RNA methylase
MRIPDVPKRIFRAYRRHGPRQFVALVAQNLRHYARALVTRAAPDPFDAAHGTETATIREVGSLDVDGRNVAFAVRYQPSDLGVVQRAIESLGIEPAEYEFIDFGAGKGRVLLQASHYAFRRIVGVEFSRELCGIAAANARSYRDPARRCAAIEVVCADATELPIPDRPLVCYFYNPFGEPVMRRVVKNLEAMNAATGAKIHVIYVDPVHEALFQASGGWVVRHRDKQFVLLASRD